MDARELRIGNWVKHRTEEGTPLQVNYTMIANCAIFGDNWIHEPIVLSKEWFEKFNFPQADSFLFKNGHYAFKLKTIISENGKDRLLYGCHKVGKKGALGECITTVEFVHQLQNLLQSLNYYFSKQYES